MTFKDIRDTLIHLGFEDCERNHFANETGLIHIYLYPGQSSSDKNEIVIKQFANVRLFGYNIPDVKKSYPMDDIESISRKGKGFVFKIKKAGELNLKENEKGENMVDNRKALDEAELEVKYAFEINTNGNIRFITLTDFTRSRAVSYAEYYPETKEWDGNKKSVNEIMSALMSNKLNIDSFGDGIVEVYSNGKTQEFK